jgi:hypothetical protein
MVRFLRSHHFIASLTSGAQLFLAAQLAHADPAEAPPESTYAEARRGFQVGVRMSAQIPSGSLENGVRFASLLGPRIHVAFDLGSKVSPYFFVGGYLGMSYGLEGSSFSDLCGASDGSGNSPTCQAESADGGLVLIATLAPARLMDPWIGITVGYEVQGLNFAGMTGVLTGVSPTALTGVDFRLRNREHRSFMSLGPYVGVTAQKYLSAKLDGSAIGASSEPIHTWFHLGIRITFPS